MDAVPRFLGNGGGCDEDVFWSVRPLPAAQLSSATGLATVAVLAIRATLHMWIRIY